MFLDNMNTHYKQQQQQQRQKQQNMLHQPNLQTSSPNVNKSRSLKIRDIQIIDVGEIKYAYEQLIKEVNYNSDLKMKEILNETSKEKFKIKNAYERKLVESKQKQWCANCGNEAIYYCCWNTSYCDEECQKVHWTQHLQKCSRTI